MEKKFEIYINKIVSKLECSKNEKEEVSEEMKDHLLLLKEEYLRKGYSEGKAVEFSIVAFGEENRIGSQLQQVMFPYLKIVKWLGSTICGLLAILMIDKGIILLNLGSNVDGNGIGINFLWIEINDRVPVQSISTYAVGFFVASTIAVLVPFVLFRKKLLRFITS